jgi:hypothetical protein
MTLLMQAKIIILHILGNEALEKKPENPRDKLRQRADDQVESKCKIGIARAPVLLNKT